MAQTAIPQDIEEHELLTILKNCKDEADYAAYQLAHPRHSRFYPEFKELANALEPFESTATKRAWLAIV
jgi:hypothetical protein